MKRIYILLLSFVAAAAVFGLSTGITVQKTQSVSPFYNLETDGGINLNNGKLAVMEMPFSDRCLSYAVPEGENVRVAVKSVSQTVTPDYLTVYPAVKRSLSVNGAPVEIPYYVFAASIDDEEYFLNVDEETHLVYWSKLTSSQTEQLMDSENNPDLFPTYKFCLPKSGAQSTSVYLQTLDIPGDAPYLLRVGASTSFVSCGKLDEIVTSYTGDICAVDYTDSSIAYVLTAWSLVAAPPTATDITAAFTDENFKAAVYETIGKTAPDAILDTDVVGITELNVSYKNISSMSGIEHFTGLQYLNCYGNQLSVLDVTTLTDLKSLACFSNNLTSLDVTTLTNLMGLSCADNQLSTLNVGNLTNLTNINCGGNQLSTLDVANLTNLTYLFCADNQLSTLDVGNLTNLINFDCRGNQLSVLDVTNLTNLIDLSCGGNQLSTLDVGNLTNLTNINCGGNQLSTLDVANLKNLTYLSCAGNQLSTLDVASLTELTSLFCDENQLSTLNVSNLTNLQQLNCENNNLTSFDVTGLTDLQSLACYNNNLTSLDVTALTGLQYLYCYNNNLTSLDVTALTGLKTLNCSDNNLTSLDVTGLDQLTHLYCNLNYLTAAPTGYDPDITTDYQFDPQKTQSIDITAAFTDENFKAAVYEKIGKTAPAPIYDTDVAGITEMDVYGKNISSLAGIEYFIGLQRLNCYNNNLTTLDVSNLTNLQRLDCGSNPISTLDVSNLTNLQYLGCDNNNLTTLDVSNLTNLQYLICFNNNLTTLDVSNLTNLQELYCYNNNLTSLDVTNLTGLGSLYCSNNNLTTLDISGLNQLRSLDCRQNYLTAAPTGYNPDITTNYQFDPQKTQSTDITAAFTDENFKAAVYEVIGKTAPEAILDTDVAGITYLDVANKNISSMNGIEYFTGLTYLDCSNNQLLTLDITNSINLTALGCAGNQLSVLDITNLTNLTWLSCSNNQLLALDIANLTHLTELYCGDNQLSILDVANLTGLTELYCRGNQLSTLNVTNLTNLTSLNCGGNQYTTLDIANLTNLTFLSCGGNHLSTLDVANLTNLTYLDCSGCQLSTLDVANLTGLTELYCNFNQLSNLNVTNLTSLLSLECAYNNISDLNVTTLTGLQYLNCSNNNLTSLDISGLNQLSYLDCRQNYLTAAPIGYNPSITTTYYFDPQKTQSVDITAAFTDENFKAAVYEKIGKSAPEAILDTDVAGITNLNVWGKNISSLDGIAYFTGLQKLYCLSNNLTSLDVSNLSNLQELYCYNNKLSSLDVSNLSDLRILGCHNNKLTSLDISNLSNLQELVCYNNNLSSLDVTTLTSLQALHCYNNNLSSLDITGLNQLSDLDCRLNYLTAAPTGYNPDITMYYLFDPQKTQSVASFYNLETDGGINLNNSKLAVMEMPFSDRCLSYATPEGEDVRVAVNAVSQTVTPDYLTVYPAVKRSLSLGGVSVEIPYYVFAASINDEEYFLNVDETRSVYWSKLTLSQTAQLLDFENNPDLFPTCKFCLPKKDAQSVYLQTLDIPGDAPYLLRVGASTSFVSCVKLDEVAASYTGDICAVDYTDSNIASAVTSWSLVAAPPTVAVTGVSLDKTAAHLLIGQTGQLTATVLPDNATNKNLTWGSSNETVATVSATGLVTAKAQGTVAITVTTEDGGFTASCTVTVTRPLSNDATLSNLTVSEGTLSPEFSPYISYYSVDVENSVESILIDATANHAEAAVSGTGTKWLNTGENGFDITVTAEDGTTETYTVIVNREQIIPVPVTGISLNQTTLMLKVDSTAQLTATVNPDDADNKTIYWSSSDNSIATVSNGFITGISEGTAVITVTTEDGGYTDFCSVTVEKNQTVVIEENKPAGANGTGRFDLSLTIPANTLFTGSFTLTLPDGFRLNVQETGLSGELSNSLTLNLTQNADGSWLFTISGNTLRSSTESVYQKIVDIVYTIDESLDNGQYEVTVNDLSLDFEDGTHIVEPEIVANVTVDHSYVGIQYPNPATLIVQMRDNYLYVNTSVEEYIQIYSVTGQLLYSQKKAAGEITVALPLTKRQMIIVKGSSGWVRKMM